MTSLRSAENSKTAAPLSRACTIALWTNSMAPTSTPRVGWLTISSDGFVSNSRAMMTFCMLPPDSEEMMVSGAAPRTSYLSMSSSAIVFIAPMLRIGPEVTGGRKWVAAMFWAMVRPGPVPTSWRSSGM